MTKFQGSQPKSELYEPGDIFLGLSPTDWGQYAKGWGSEQKMEAYLPRGSGSSPKCKVNVY